MFSRNMQQATREEVKQVLEVSSEANSVKYLGLPIHVARLKTSSFQHLKERIGKHIKCWSEKILSMDGKEI